MLAQIGPNRLLGIAGAVAITLILQAHAYSWYVWIPVAIIAYAICPMFLVPLLLPFWFLTQGIFLPLRLGSVLTTTETTCGLLCR
jgi:hypothetical protein